MYNREYLIEAITKKINEAPTGMLETIYYFLIS